VVIALLATVFGVVAAGVVPRSFAAQSAPPRRLLSERPSGSARRETTNRFEAPVIERWAIQ
jgi:hypothetical protein